MFYQIYDKRYLMSLVSRLTTAAHHYWQQLPKESIPALAFLGGAILATQVSSNSRIRAAIILTPATLLFLAQRIKKLFVSNKQPPLVSTLLHEDHSSLYFKVLPAAVLTKLGVYLSYADKQAIARGDGLQDWQTALLKTDPESEKDALHFLSTMGIIHYPQFRESAVEHIQRQQSIVDLRCPPNQSHTPVNAHLLHEEAVCVPSGRIIKIGVLGPVLLIESLESTIAFYWPTGREIYRLESNAAPFNFITGETFQKSFLVLTSMGLPSLEQFERIEPKKLFNYTFQVEICLKQQCDSILVAQFPYLVFTNAEGTWFKKGNEEEIKFEEQLNPDQLSRFAPNQLCTTRGIFSCETGRKISGVKSAAYGQNKSWFVEGSFICNLTHQLQSISRGPNTKELVEQPAIKINTSTCRDMIIPIQLQERVAVELLGLYNGYVLLKGQKKNSRQFYVVDTVKSCIPN